MHGAWRQRWLDDPTAPGCKVTVPLVKLNHLINDTNPSPRDRWHVMFDRHGPPPPIFEGELESLGLPTGDEAYRHIEIQQTLARPEGFNDYFHHTGEGVIVALDVKRYDGPHWSEIAFAQYTSEFPIETLRDFFHHQLYPRRNRLPFNDEGNTAAQIPVAWIFGTHEYQGILGTVVGKAVCALLLSAFPRGTRRIARILSWKQNKRLQLRFEIEETACMQSGSNA
ncbi:uncharacterized protein N7529_002467 [Penicillium soppii]|uniref:uncharacterized protein n=1 Tax=Penicillium soppii TaxID=69789 RepID=UPI0025491834|nr:uncharacterized protein N7529_002467 [Penicillium soppii]KAJ5874037.1 hypothetical protein N7529_002467 [Penicillium soppii]